MEANNILILKFDGYESSYDSYHLCQQKFKFNLWELKWRLTKPFQVKFESIVDEELIWRLKYLDSEIGRI